MSLTWSFLITLAKKLLPNAISLKRNKIDSSTSSSFSWAKPSKQPIELWHWFLSTGKLGSTSVHQPNQTMVMVVHVHYLSPVPLFGLIVIEHARIIVGQVRLRQVDFFLVEILHVVGRIFDTLAFLQLEVELAKSFYMSDDHIESFAGIAFHSIHGQTFHSSALFAKRNFFERRSRHFAHHAIFNQQIGQICCVHHYLYKIRVLQLFASEQTSHVTNHCIEHKVGHLLHFVLQKSITGRLHAVQTAFDGHGRLLHKHRVQFEDLDQRHCVLVAVVDEKHLGKLVINLFDHCSVPLLILAELGHTAHSNLTIGQRVALQTHILIEILQLALEFIEFRQTIVYLGIETEWRVDGGHCDVISLIVVKCSIGNGQLNNRRGLDPLAKAVFHQMLS
ncbi:hypothetical protein BpHYR1_039596 [Brachionus plicatilis]|uniref:Uncharacterized protein n=1 Tax=Brachionus plicatilis TaxID=10195 RepID=A0A3M7QNR1_BRAPC|nr:hypothetical protein BpHYR1_039596 [Brachionus plicatilis]